MLLYHYCLTNINKTDSYYIKYLSPTPQTHFYTGRTVISFTLTCFGCVNAYNTASAISCGSSFLRSVGLYAAVIAVSTIPGEILVTLTPVFANSFSNP